MAKAADKKEEVLFVPKNLVFEKIGKFMSESKFLKNSIVSPGQNKVENAIKNLYIYKNCVEVVNE